MKPFDESELPEYRSPSVEEATGEGLMLADYANRMKVKNAIIVGVLARGNSYDPDHYVEAATDAIGRLAAEFDSAADRIRHELTAIAELKGSALHAHDYRAGDVGNLKHREEVLHALVAELRSRCDDRGYLLGLIESARQDAWGDISRAVEESLDREIIVVDETYDRERARRMRQVARDLTRLAAASGR